MSEFHTAVVLVLDGHVPETMIDQEMMKRITDYGVIVDKVDQEMGVIEGTLLSSKLSGLAQLEGVSYVRQEASYWADDTPQSE